jgi:hypothetical protein
MKNNYNIPILNIPKSTNKNEFKILSYNFIYFINNFFKFIKKDIDTEKIISEQNNYYNKDLFDGVYSSYNLIQYELYKRINDKKFWIELLSKKTCDYIYKDGKRYKEVCGKSIEIECNDGLESFKCAKHVSKKSYKSCTKNINKDNLCIHVNNKNKPCGKNKYTNNYCIYHYGNAYEYNKSKYINYLDINKELDILYNIEIIYSNNSINNKIISNRDKIKNDAKDIDKKSININSLYNIVEDIKNGKCLGYFKDYKSKLDIESEKLNNIEIDIKEPLTPIPVSLNQNINDNTSIEKLKKNIINIIHETYDEYVLIYIYNFIKKEKTQSPGHRRTITN